MSVIYKVYNFRPSADRFIDEGEYHDVSPSLTNDLLSELSYSPEYEAEQIATMIKYLKTRYQDGQQETQASTSAPEMQLWMLPVLVSSLSTFPSSFMMQFWQPRTVHWISHTLKKFSHTYHLTVDSIYIHHFPQLPY